MAHLDISAAKVGDVLPNVVFGPISRSTLALYAGASGDHNPVHIDLDFARSNNLPDVFAQGMLSFGILAQVATRWAGIARLRDIQARFLSITQVHDLVTCQGVVSERLERAGEQLLRISLTATTQDGRETMGGEALVAVD